MTIADCLVSGFLKSFLWDPDKSLADNIECDMSHLFKKKSVCFEVNKDKYRVCSKKCPLILI